MSYRIFYDADCPICQREMSLLSASNNKANLLILPVQGNEYTLAKYGIEREAALTLIHLITPDDVVVSGMPALRLVYAQCNRPLMRFWNLPGIRQFSDWGYPYFARYRYYVPRWLLPRAKCSNGTCYKKR